MIKNKIANSQLVLFEIERHYPNEKRIEFDVSDFLWKGLVLKEKAFRTTLKQYDWSIFENQYVAIVCSTNAIVPSWAYMLLTLAFKPFTKDVIVGSLVDLENKIACDFVAELDVESFRDKKVLIKGCSQIKIPEMVYGMLCKKMVDVVFSLMFGEACSNVPLFKKTRVKKR